LPLFNYKFYYSKSTQILLQKEAESARKQVLVQILGPRCSSSELFKVFSKLISISSIMIEVRWEVDQNHDSMRIEVSEELMGSQISNNQWYGFFKAIDKINSYNFNIMTWFI
jgi:hypothetical protein